VDFQNVIYVHNEVLYSPKKNGILPLVANWPEMEDIVLREISLISLKHGN
jgi:hypothetical protein